MVYQILWLWGMSFLTQCCYIAFLCLYRVSQKKRPTLVLLISQLSKGLEIPSWTFFKSSFRVEIKNAPFLLFGDIWTEILRKY